MKIKLFSIYDNVALDFGQVFPSPTFGSAERALKESVNNPDSPHAKNPSDFSLYHVGTFDSDTGLIEPVTVIQMVPVHDINGTEMHQEEREVPVGPSLLVQAASLVSQ